MLLLDDVYLLNFVVRLQWANGFSFLIFLIDGLAVYSFLFVWKRSVLSLGPCGPKGQLFLRDFELMVHCVMLFVFSQAQTDNCTVFCCDASLIFIIN